MQIAFVGTLLFVVHVRYNFFAMSKSLQFAVPADVPVSVPQEQPSLLRKRLRIAGWIVGVIAALVAITVLAYGIVDASARQQPVNQRQVIQSLAGVPLFPDVKFDEELTREARGELATSNWLNPNKLKTVAGLRTSASPKEMVAFYDSRMPIMGFTKTALDDGKFLRGANGIGGASYTTTDTTIVIQMNKEEGEDNQLIITRFDRESRSMLRQASNVVVPQDFEKAEKEAEKKKRQQKQTEEPKK
jgi:hypothetical protein